MIIIAFSHTMITKRFIVYDMRNVLKLVACNLILHWSWCFMVGLCRAVFFLDYQFQDIQIYGVCIAVGGNSCMLSRHLWWTSVCVQMCVSLKYILTGSNHWVGVECFAVVSSERGAALSANLIISSQRSCHNTQLNVSIPKQTWPRNTRIYLRSSQSFWWCADK